MKLLYIGVFLDGTGYSQAAIDYALALDSVGVNVVCRPLKLNNRVVKPPQRILELIEKSSSNCDCVIQHTLPHMMYYSGEFKKNIALYASETDSFVDTVWAKRLNHMDEVWVINNQMVEAATKSGVTKPITVVPHTANINNFAQSYKLIPELQKLKNEGKFIFYFIGEPIRRKNMAALLKAFHTEFNPSEPVELVIKTSGTDNQIKESFQQIKDGLKFNKYKDEIIINRYLSDEEILSLHASCDCLVAPSYGEAWNIPAFTAMAMGKTPIVTGWGGFKDYMNNHCGWLCNYHMEPVFGVKESFQDLYTGNESWASIDIFDLRKCMRGAYQQAETRKAKAINGIQQAYNFDYEKVGNLMKGLLESYEQEPQTLERH